MVVFDRGDFFFLFALADEGVFGETESSKSSEVNSVFNLRNMTPTVQRPHVERQLFPSALVQQQDV